MITEGELVIKTLTLNVTSIAGWRITVTTAQNLPVN